jgi:hypothetical protein
MVPETTYNLMSTMVMREEATTVFKHLTKIERVLRMPVV